ncbi:MAG: isopeptide-forming domain-containing fimbrial protein [Lachnospiraceae bacterium]|nr:isopeptide-forming domain-containing fimbrial protein [Lachnospiraceae bacterium]
MKKMKKFLAMMLAMVMVLGMSVTALAEQSKPVETDSAVITVNGVKTGATVKAYKIAEGKWNDFGFTGYSAVEVGGVTIKDLANPTAEEVMSIANAVDKENEGISVVESTTTAGIYTADLPVGMYLILVTKNASEDMTVYNPMIASVYYSVEGTGDNNEAIGGAVSAEDKFEVNGQEIFAKSMNPNITKEIVNSGSGNNLGDDTAIGDSITFRVKTAFPGYSDEYTKVEFNVIDTLSKGLTLDAESVTVEVTGAKEQPVKDTDYTVEAVTDSDSKETTMTISFTSNYILANRNNEVIVQYTAALNGDAGLNFDENTNTVKAEYTNNPTTGSKGETEEKKTYHYTFGIDASINGSWDEITKELLKTGEEFVTGSTTEKAPLDGATFTLTSKTTPAKVYTTISGKGEVGKDVDENGNALAGAKEIPSGYLKFTGLDAGEYVLQETKAPEGYSLNPVEIPVKIEAVYNTDGTLSSYTITVDGTKIESDGEKVSKYEATYEKNDETDEMDKTVGNVNSNTQQIPNTKIIGLPSTGGIGTTIFTIGGCAIMIIAAGLFFASRRKKVK